MSKCSCCEYLEALHSTARNIDRNNAVPEYEFVKRFSVAIVEHDISNDGRRGTIADFGYPLNWCPECGRSLKEDMK